MWKEFTEEAYFDSGRFIEVVKSMISGLDELLDLLGDRHALEAQRVHVQEWREVGLGVMGLADLALTMGLGYGTGIRSSIRYYNVNDGKRGGSGFGGNC